jgi:hypothetical protein
MAPPLSLELPPPSARRRQRRTRYQRRWRLRQRNGCIATYVEYHHEHDVDALVRAGFLDAQDREDSRAVRVALQYLLNQALDRAALGQFNYYRSGAVGQKSG